MAGTLAASALKEAPSCHEPGQVQGCGWGGGGWEADELQGKDVGDAAG